MLFGIVNPAVRLAIGVVVLVIAVVLHRVILEASGAVIIVLGAVQWVHRSRGGAAGSRWGFWGSGDGRR